MENFYTGYPVHPSLLQLSEGQKNRYALLAISATLESSDGVFLRKEGEEKLLERLESVKNLYMRAKNDTRIVIKPGGQYMKFLYIEYVKAIQDLENEILRVKASIKKLEKTYTQLVLRTKELIKQVRDSKAIVIMRESELHLLMEYCFADPEYGNYGAVPTKMIEIDAELRGEELKDVIHQVQMRGWLSKMFM